MNWEAFLKPRLGKLAGASLVKMGDIIILTSIAGWFASSAAQVIGIALNKNYTREQKKFMIAQETFDCITNIGLYFGVTKSLTSLTAHMVKTGKLAPKSIAEFMRTNNLLGQRGKFGFDVTQAAGFSAAGLTSTYNSFKGFTDAAAATVGGIISSNILTPIVRNYFASKRQNQYKAKMQMAENPVSPVMTSASKMPNPVYQNYQRHTFGDFASRAMRV